MTVRMFTVCCAVFEELEALCESESVVKAYGLPR